MHTQQDFCRRHDGSGIERNLGQRNDGNDTAQQVGQCLRVPGCQEDVGRNGIQDIVSKHEQTGNGGRGVKQVREGECDL